ncbi:MAG: hypothetical protein HY018_10170 [Hydrogenophilales bacterium]|nr:hypothetical protein [Hydrogenophilales bacterium]
MEVDRALDSAQKVSIVIDALKAGTLKVRKQDETLVRKLLALPRGITGLVDITSLAPEDVSIARAMALAMASLRQEQQEAAGSTESRLHDAQCELFRLFEEIFVGLTGAPSEVVKSQDEIKARMLDRVRDNDNFDDFNAVAGELEQFYQQNAASLFNIAKSLGGVKVVTGGQRTYGPSALAATRVAGLYCDTQLIPDPVAPFFSGNLHLNAMHLQLAIVLFYILPLRPLIDARLPEPPVFIFPSFEEMLEEKDAITQSGIASLMVKVVAPACNANLTTIDELLEFARKDENSFLDAISRERLFVPPGGDPKTVGSAQQAASIYLRELKGIRSDEALSAMERAPRGVLVFNGVLERLRPIYHLMENAEELAAQPMLSQGVHWYYFERCAQAEARELVNEHVLSRESLDVLRALQDDSLTWLANIPIEGLVDLRRNLEHAEFREQLKKCTAQLTSAAPAELEAVTKEVKHALEVMIQRQQKAIKDIEAKYSPKKWAAAVGGALSTAAGASMFFMPALAAASGVTAPVASVIAGLGGGGVAYAREFVGQVVEKRKARKTLLGLLATAHGVSK